jgi:predicted GNAT superfamily acetyltransferase
MTAADLAAVLALNATAEGLVEPLGPDRLDWLRLIAAHAAVVDLDGRPAGFVLTFTPGRRTTASSSNGSRPRTRAASCSSNGS